MAHSPIQEGGRPQTDAQTHSKTRAQEQSTEAPHVAAQADLDSVDSIHARGVLSGRNSLSSRASPIVYLGLIAVVAAVAVLIASAA